MNRIQGLISMHCVQNCKSSLGASKKGKNDVTSGCPADPKVSENACY